MSRSDLNLFLTNLHLLDLDLQPDWPDITKQTFSTKDQSNQKKRINSTEWALYRLFELWDPAETRSKLQPFFPPFEPLQSINLRAALFRCMNELKKTGVLGRETVLRKTMLDECKGEKFTEVLLVFSTAVLKKQIAKSQRKLHHSTVHRIAHATSLQSRDQDALVPLAIVHTCALRKGLAQRAENKALFDDLSELLSITAEDVNTRIQNCQASAKRLENELDGIAEQGALRKTLRDNWVANQQWLDVVLRGDEKQGEDDILEGTYHDFLARFTPGDDLPEPSPSNGLLEDLNRRVELQEGRLHRWRNFHQKRLDEKSEANETQRPKAIRKEPASNAVIDFSRYEAIQIGTTTKLSTDIQAPRTFIRYQGIIDNMLKDVGSVSVKRDRASQAILPRLSPIVARNRPAESSTSPDIPGRLTARTTKDQDKALPLSSAPARVVSKSKDIERPAPLVPDTYADDSNNTRRTPYAHARVHGDITNAFACLEASEDDVDKVDGHSKGQSVQSSRKFASVIANHPILAAPRPPSPPSPPKQTLAEQIVASVAEATPSPVKRPRPSLAERTRMSMAALSAPSDLPDISESPAPQPPSPPPISLPDASDRRTTLLERTRQSMSLMTANPKPRKSLSQKRSRQSRQSLFPINQFETPKKRDSWLPEEEEDTQTTPKEKLFGESADYDSVFKPRPKIAMSPVPSPSFVDADESEEYDDAEVGVSSPLGRFQRRRS